MLSLGRDTVGLDWLKSSVRLDNGRSEAVSEIALVVTVDWMESNDLVLSTGPSDTEDTCTTSTLESMEVSPPFVASAVVRAPGEVTGSDASTTTLSLGCEMLLGNCVMSAVKLDTADAKLGSRMIPSVAPV
jgi:hypothetical protein